MVVRYLLVLAVTILACAIPNVSQTSPPTAGSVTVPAKRSPSEVSELLKKARDGDAAAQFEIGRAYDTGEGVRENPQQAAVWYRKSAEQGNPKAQNSLGVLYWSGNGVERSKEQAVRWYRKSARQGDSDAMFNIGAAYYNGEGVENVDAI